MSKVKMIGLTVLRYAGLRILLSVICLGPLFLGICVMLCGDYEKAQRTLIPRYLWSEDELIRKHLFTMSPGLEFMSDRYGSAGLGNLESYRRSANVLAPMARQMQARGMRVEGMIPAVRDFNDYKNSLEPDRLIVPDLIVKRLFPVFIEKKYSVMAEEMFANLRNSNDVPEWMKEAFPDQLERAEMMDSLESLTFAIMNNELGSSYVRFDEVPVPVQSVTRPPRWRRLDSAEWRLWADFLRGLPGQYKWMPTAEVYWRGYLRRKYQGDVESLNRSWSSAWKSFSEIPFDRKAYLVPPLLDDWSEFVRFVWPRDMLYLSEGHDDNWRGFLKDRSFDGAGPLTEIIVKGGDEVQSALSLPLNRPEDPAIDLLWCDFIESDYLPLEAVNLITHADEFGPFQRSQYLGGRIISLNEEWHTDYDSFVGLPLPLGLNDLALFPRDASELRREYAGESWFAAVKSLDFPPGILFRSLSIIGGMVVVSMLISVIFAYIMARFPVRIGPHLSVVAIASALVPVSFLMTGYGVSLTGALGDLRWFTLSLFGASVFGVLIMRGCFLDIVKRNREQSYLDGVGELGFIFRFVVRHSWHVVLYTFVLQLLIVYCAVDWQILTNGRLWSWTIGVWAVDQAGAAAPVKAAVALLGMVPVFIVAGLAYPLFSRFCIMPVLRRPSK